MTLGVPLPGVAGMCCTAPCGVVWHVPPGGWDESTAAVVLEKPENPGGNAGAQVLWEDGPSRAGGPTCPQGLESRVGVRWVELFRGVQVSVGDAGASESELIYFFISLREFRRDIYSCSIFLGFVLSAKQRWFQLKTYDLVVSQISAVKRSSIPSCTLCKGTSGRTQTGDAAQRTICLGSSSRSF